MVEKRQEIIGKVKELFNKFGIRSITMDDIVREVGVSKKTLYQYFTDKSELVQSVIECASLEKMKEHKDTIEGSSNAIEEMMRFYSFQAKMIKESNPSLIYDLKKYYPDIHEKFVERKREIIYENVLTNLNNGIKEGLYRKDLDPKVISSLNLMRVESIMNSQTQKAQEILSQEFFLEMFKYHMYGIVSEKGRKIFEEKIEKTI